MNDRNDKFSEDKVFDYLLGHLEGQELIDFEQQLSHDAALRETVEDSRQAVDFYTGIDNITVPETSAAMDDKFYQMLNQAKRQEQSSLDKVVVFIKNSFSFEKLTPVLYGGAMLALGVYLGHHYQLQSVDNGLDNKYIAAKKSSDMEQLAVVSMLQLPSVSTRLQAVNLVENSDNQVSDKVISALLYTLNNDTNINVRLATLNTLAKYSQMASVRMGLVDAIANQDSPMVQVAISELMLKMQEVKAIKPLQELLKNESTISTAKEKITNTLNQLI